MKELNNAEMQAVSGAGIFDSMLTINSPVMNAINKIITPFMGPVAKGIFDLIENSLDAIQNVLNGWLGSKTK